MKDLIIRAFALKLDEEHQIYEDIKIIYALYIALAIYILLMIICTVAMNMGKMNTAYLPYISSGILLFIGAILIFQSILKNNIVLLEDEISIEIDNCPHLQTEPKLRKVKIHHLCHECIAKDLCTIWQEDDSKSC